MYAFSFFALEAWQFLALLLALPTYLPIEAGWGFVGAHSKLGVVTRNLDRKYLGENATSDRCWYLVRKRTLTQVHSTSYQVHST